MPKKKTNIVTHKMAAKANKMAAKEREHQSFERARAKFAEEEASTESISEREARRKREKAFRSKGIK